MQAVHWSEGKHWEAPLSGVTVFDSSGTSYPICSAGPTSRSAAAWSPRPSRPFLFQHQGSCSRVTLPWATRSYPDTWIFSALSTTWWLWLVLIVHVPHVQNGRLIVGPTVDMTLEETFAFSPPRRFCDSYKLPEPGTNPNLLWVSIRTSRARLECSLARHYCT